MDEHELQLCRETANALARRFLCSDEYSNGSNTATSSSPPVAFFAGHRAQRQAKFQDYNTNKSNLPEQSTDGHAFLTPHEEAVLVSFYASKLPALIGPGATLNRLRRDSKVLATATMLYRRFYLSNSVQTHDPKVTMVAAAFLATKVEDCMADVRYLVEGTVALNAPVTAPEIVTAELALLQGLDFYLLCFHPYKAVLALTEDLRTFFKTEKGKNLLQEQGAAAAGMILEGSEGEEEVSTVMVVTGNDLAPVYEAARDILNDVVVSDIPLQYSPGQIGLAALAVAAERVREVQPSSAISTDLLLKGYLRVRFPNKTPDTTLLEALAVKLRQLPEGRHGCAKYHTDMTELKGIHKKLKKVRAWGERKKKSSKRDNKPDKGDDEGAAEPYAKRVKAE